MPLIDTYTPFKVVVVFASLGSAYLSSGARFMQD